MGRLASPAAVLHLAGRAAAARRFGPCGPACSGLALPPRQPGCRLAAAAASSQVSFTGRRGSSATLRAPDPLRPAGCARGAAQAQAARVLLPAVRQQAGAARPAVGGRLARRLLQRSLRPRVLPQPQNGACSHEAPMRGRLAWPRGEHLCCRSSGAWWSTRARCSCAAAPSSPVQASGPCLRGERLAPGASARAPGASGHLSGAVSGTALLQVHGAWRECCPGRCTGDHGGVQCRRCAVVGPLNGPRPAPAEAGSAAVEQLLPFSHLDIPAIGQAYLIFRARLRPPAGFSSGAESTEVRLFDLPDIPWAQARPARPGWCPRADAVQCCTCA